MKQDDLTQQAAEWLVALSDETQDQSSLAAAYEQWKQADPRHAEAAESMEAFLGRLNSVSTLSRHQPAMITTSLDAGMKLQHAKTRPIWPMLMLIIMLLPFWSLAQVYLPSHWWSDFNTVTGEWQQHLLADGSQLTLGSHSAVDVEFDAEQRTISVLSGDLWVDVAKDAARPFVVKTHHGQITALGTRFIVRLHEHATQLIMLESSVQVQHDSAQQLVHAGQQLYFDHDGIGQISAVDASSFERSWQSKTLLVEGMPLSDVLSELDTYRQGKLLFDRSAMSALTVSAVLPLHDTDAALSLLQARYPQLRIQSATPLLTYLSIEPAQAGIN